MNISEINAYDDFIITGKWGFEEGNLSYSGTLSYDRYGINLRLLNLGHLDSSIGYTIYGKGILVINGKETLVHCVSLLDCHIYDQGFSFSIGQSSLHSSVARSRQLFISSIEYISDESTFDMVYMYVTNFSQWLKGLSDDNYKDGLNSISDNEIRIFINKSEKDNENNNLLSRTSGKDITNTISIDNPNGNTFSINDIDTYESIISGYLSMVTNTREQIIKMSLYCESGSCFYFHPQKNIKSVKNEFLQERTYIRRNKKLLLIILQSLLNWIKNRDTLMPIYSTSLNLSNSSALNQQLSSVFAGLDLIYSNYVSSNYPKENPKNASFGMKVFRILNHLDKNIIDEVLKAFPSESINCDEQNCMPKNTDYPNEEKLREFCERIRELRNITDHGLDKLSKIRIDNKEKYRFKLASQFIVREWLLQNIKIPSEIIDKELIIPDYLPNNYDLIWN